jgi:hypothetical protein
VEGGDDPNFLQVHFELSDEAQVFPAETCFVVHSLAKAQHPFPYVIAPCIRKQASEFLSHRLSRHWKKPSNNHGDKGDRNKNGINKFPAVLTQPVLEPAKDTTAVLDRKSPMPRTSPFLPKNSPSPKVPEAQINEVSCRMNVQNGLAILDTGASRSVIGADNVPAVLQK